MLPIKYKTKLFKDKRGYLTEITPKLMFSKFSYSILTNSKKMFLEVCILIKRWMKKS